jgi:hypothetical protein
LALPGRGRRLSDRGKTAVHVPLNLTANWPSASAPGFGRELDEGSIQWAEYRLTGNLLDLRKGEQTMTTLTFDALQFVQRLKKAGIKEVEAEAIAEALRDAHVSLEEKITESSAKSATKQDLEIVQKSLETKIAETKVELVRWVLTVGVLQTALIGALVMRLIPS